MRLLHRVIIRNENPSDSLNVTYALSIEYLNEFVLPELQKNASGFEVGDDPGFNCTLTDISKDKVYFGMSKEEAVDVFTKKTLEIEEDK